MADITSPKKVRAEIKDVNLLSEEGIVRVFYDNDGYLLEVMWFRGHSYFDLTEHDEVLVMVAMDEDAFGFMIHGAEWISDGIDGYVTVNLKSKLEKYVNAISSIGQANGQGASGTSGGWHYNPIEQGIINVRYDRDKYYCDVFWAKRDTHYTETENKHILALVDTEGILCGFRIINTDELRKDERGVTAAELKISMGVKSV